MRKRILAWVLTVCFCVACLPLPAIADGYPSIEIKNIPTFRQRLRYTIPASINPNSVSVDVSEDGKYADCGIDCIAMIEAYFKGYPSESDLVYHAAIAGANPTIQWKTITEDPGNQVFLYPTRVSGYVNKTSMSAEEIYAQLKAGNPVMAHRMMTVGGYEHWVVIYGYDGPSDLVRLDRFMIMSPTFKSVGVEYLHLSDLIPEGDYMLNGFVYRNSGIEDLPPNGPFTLDINGYIDGKPQDNIYNYGTFDLYLNDKKVKNDEGDYWETNTQAGTRYEIKDIKPAEGYYFVGAKSGALSGVVSGDTTVVLEFRTKPETVVLDVNGLLDGKELDNIEGIGTFDSYVDEEKTETGISDYYHGIFPFGSKYEFKNIKAKDGYEYIGPASHSGRANGDTKVLLEFRKKPEISVSFSPWESSKGATYIRETDASIGQVIDVSGGNCTETGIFLFDASGNKLAQAKNNGYSDHRIYFQLNAEAKYTLKPGTTYKYKFYAVVEGKTYWSKEYSFKTTGTSATPSPKPTPTVKPTATPTAKPTATPTAKPPATPTAKPTATPTAKPTATPTATPTAKPTETPTAKPTATPTSKPTEAPTAKPTEAPTAKPTEAPTSQPTAMQGPHVKISGLKNKLSVWKKASGDSDRLGYAYNGDVYELLEVEGDWYKIRYGDKVGYVTGIHVTPVGADHVPHKAHETPKPVTPAPTAYVTISGLKNKLSVWKEADGGSDRLGYVYNGDVLELMAVKGDWYMVRFGDRVGFVTGEHVKATNAHLVPRMEEDKTPPPTDTPSPTPANTPTPMPTDPLTAAPKPAELPETVEAAATKMPVSAPTVITPTPTAFTKVASGAKPSATPPVGMPVTEEQDGRDPWLGIAMIGAGGLLVATMGGTAVALIRHRSRRVRGYRDDTDDFEEI